AAPSAKSPESESAPTKKDSDGAPSYAPQAPTGGAAPKSMEASRGQAHSELDRAERELAGAAGDCAAACRALASMERATGHLCDLTSQADSSCEDARSKVRTARDRVRSTCGSCPGGPSLERSAPIPSP
ncbi:MAG: hypothetical protein ABIP39_13415, partial [Polyangiaceae bacterium]